MIKLSLCILVALFLWHVTHRDIPHDLTKFEDTERGITCYKIKHIEGISCVNTAR